MPCSRYPLVLSLERIQYSVLTFRLITPYEQALLCGFLMETAWWLSVRYLTADLKAIVLVLSMTMKVISIIKYQAEVILGWRVGISM